MKIEHLLAHHLYYAKKLTLQGIGTFTLPEEFALPSASDKITEMAPGTITFTQNTKAIIDEGLINFIVQHTGKMKPLATSDIESFIGLGSQFLNIGKPLKIDGIGVLEKNQLGQYLFTQYNHFVQIKSEPTTVKLKEKREETISFSEKERKSNVGLKKVLSGFAILAAAAAVAWAAWGFYKDSQKQSSVIAENTTEKQQVSNALKPDTSSVNPQKPDSITTNINTQPAVVTADGYSFKVVVKTYTTLAQALRKQAFFNTTYKHNLIVYTADSLSFGLAVPFTRPLADTALVRDSLRNNVYSGNPYIVLK